MTDLATPHHVFISHASPDRAVAEEICAGLEATGLKCWIASRDASGEYAGQITQAIRSASVFVLVLSSSANGSGHVQNEVAIAGDQQIPMLPVRIGNVDPHEAIEFYVRKWQWTAPIGAEEVRAHAMDIATRTRALASPVRVATGAVKQAAPPGWRWWSRDRSPDDGIVSILSLVETTIAMGAYAIIIYHWGTLHLAVSASLAPLLLFRTPESTAMARRWATQHAPVPSKDEDRIGARIAALSPLDRVLLTLTIAPLALVIGSIGSLAPMAMRFLSTIRSTVSDPGRAFAQVPSNWWRIVACTDMGCRPEPIPGIPRAELAAMASWEGRWLLDPITDIWPPSRAIKHGLPQWVYLPTLLPVVVLTMAYRWSIKGTALLLSPFIWITRSTFSMALLTRLRDLHELALFRLTRGWAMALLVGLSVKCLVFNSTGSRLACDNFLPSVVCANVIVPHSLPPWQFAVLFNAILAWILYLIADWALHRMSNGRLPAERFLDGFFKTMWLTQGVLSLYTIACSIYLAVVLSERWPRLPALGTRLFPW